MIDTDREFLSQALKLAQQSPEPVGCGVILVKGKEVIAQAYNSQRADNIAIYHAEIKAILEANKLTGSRKLGNVTAYCSCEPCAMCLTALSYAKVERIVFNKTMRDLFPEDPQSHLNPYEYIQGLNFKPKLERLSL